MLPVLTQSVAANIEPGGIRSCDLLASAAEWTAFCADNGLVCEPYDDEFFDVWVIVAVTIETMSPFWMPIRE